MEERFIRFAWAIGVRPSVLDALIWRDMKVAGHFAREILHHHQKKTRKPNNSPSVEEAVCQEAVAMVEAEAAAGTAMGWTVHR
jgi:hypothetical protein